MQHNQTKALYYHGLLTLWFLGLACLVNVAYANDKEGQEKVAWPENSVVCREVPAIKLVNNQEFDVKLFARTLSVGESASAKMLYEFGSNLDNEYNIFNLNSTVEHALIKIT